MAVKKAVKKRATLDKVIKPPPQDKKSIDAVIEGAEDHPERPKDGKRSPDELQKFMSLALKRFNMASEASDKTRSEALNDLRFYVGDQWTDDILNDRTLSNKPCIVINRIRGFVNQVTNEQRQQRPAINVTPISGGAAKETAEVIQGMVRHIDNISDAEIAYDMGFFFMVVCGFGYWRIVTEYADDAPNDASSFNDQEIKIKAVYNPFTVYFDPRAHEPGFIDAMFCFVIEDMPKEEYKAQFPDSDVASLTEFSSTGDAPADWITRDTVRIAEYWYVTTQEKKIYLLDSGEIVEEVPEGRKPVKERTIVTRSVKMAKINAKEILEESDWAGKYLPIIPVLGTDIDIDGQRHQAGLVRSAKDPQRTYNWMVSAMVQTIGMAPTAPWVATAEQIEGYEDEYQTANIRNVAVVHYKHVEGAPPPQRQIVEPPIEAISQAVRQADSDLQGTTNLFNPNLGKQQGDQSGKAINLLQQQGTLTNSDWIDNLSRAMRQTGRAEVDLIPKIYDTARVQRIINPDGTTKHVGIFNSRTDGTAEQVKALADADAIKEIYDLGVGRFDVTITTGPSYATRRQQSSSDMVLLAKNLPAVAQVAPDIIVQNMDFPGNDQVAERLRKMLPPQLQDADPGDPKVQLQQATQAAQQLGQQNQQLQIALKHQEEINNTKQIEMQGKLQQEQLKAQNDIEIAKIRAAASITVAEITTKAQSELARAKMEQEAFLELHSDAHETGMMSQDQIHAQDNMQMQNDNAAAEQAEAAQAQPAGEGAPQ